MVRPCRVWTGFAVLACLSFTGSHVAWADPAQLGPSQLGPSQLGIEYIEDPYAPHVTNGSTLRLGTSIGFIHDARVGSDVLSMGGTLSGGQRFGRLAIEAELSLANLESTGTGDPDVKLGTQQRLGVIARFDVLRLGSHVVGPNSMAALYVEGGAAQVWTQWLRPDADDMTTRTVPDNSGRVEGEVGFGIMIDHRLQEPITVPRRVGWFLGWRMGFAPHDAETAAICRGESCRTATPMPDATYTDRTLLFQSSMQVTW
jgi:hypothetical protein